MTLSIVPHDKFTFLEFQQRIAYFNELEHQDKLNNKLFDFLSKDVYRIASSSNHSKLFLAIEEQEVVGYIFYKKVPLQKTDFYHYLGNSSFNLEEMHYVAYEVEYLCVKPLERNKGIGRALISKVIVDFQLEKNAMLIELWALTTEVSFYQKFQFQVDWDDGSQPFSKYMCLMKI